jgi:hypothetical protein
MLDVNSSTHEVLDAILKDKTADEQIKILRELYGDAVGHGWVDDELRDNILASACRDYDVEYNAADEEEDDDDLEEDFEEAVGR